MSPTVIVLFPANTDQGFPAITFDKVDEDENTVTYTATFEKKTPVQGPAQPQTEAPALADMRIGPEQVEAISDSGGADDLPDEEAA